MNTLKEKIEEVLRNRVIEIADDYKGRKFENGVQVYLGYPKLLIDELTDLFPQSFTEKIKAIEGLKKSIKYQHTKIDGLHLKGNCDGCSREKGFSNALSQVLSILTKNDNENKTRKGKV